MLDPEDFYRYLGQRIMEERVRNGLTQAGLASKISLTRTSLANIERGRQKLLAHVLVDIASALNVNVIDLLPKQVGVETTQADEVKLDKLLEERPADEQQWIKAVLDKTNEE